MIADLGNGQSVAYVCDPGKHTIIGRSVEIKTVVEAEFAPDQTYDFTTEGGGFWIASFGLVPITTENQDLRAEVPMWLESHLLVEREQTSEALREYERDYKDALDVIMDEADTGVLKKITFGPDNRR